VDVVISVADEGMLVPLMLVAEAVPSEGLVSDGELERTTEPEPVVLSELPQATPVLTAIPEAGYTMLVLPVAP
jgi:hypothetical protein